MQNQVNLLLPNVRIWTSRARNLRHGIISYLYCRTTLFILSVAAPATICECSGYARSHRRIRRSEPAVRMNGLVSCLLVHNACTALGETWKWDDRNVREGLWSPQLFIALSKPCTLTTYGHGLFLMFYGNFKKREANRAKCSLCSNVFQPLLIIKLHVVRNRKQKCRWYVDSTWY